MDLPETWTVSRNALSPVGYPMSYYRDARKFDAGGKANSILLPMLERSVEEVLQLGDLTDIQLRLQRLMGPLFDYVAKDTDGRYYISSPQDRAYHIIGLIAKNKTPTELIGIQNLLQSNYKVLVAVRCGGIRISPYVNTTKDDVDALIWGLQELS
jgi:selenocysteine lyase/cysteine desulfurase